MFLTDFFQIFLSSRKLVVIFASLGAEWHFRPLFWISCKSLLRFTEPDDADRKKKTSKSKVKGSIPKPGNDSKPNISYPTVDSNSWNSIDSHKWALCTIFVYILVSPYISQQNFEHTVHVGFDAITGEFTVNMQNFFRLNFSSMPWNYLLFLFASFLVAYISFCYCKYNTYFSHDFDALYSPYQITSIFFFGFSNGFFLIALFKLQRHSNNMSIFICAGATWGRVQEGQT